MTRQLSRRAQNASGAAVLVATIAGLIILYLLFLSPEDRNALLFGEDGSGGFNNWNSGYTGGYNSVNYGSVLIMTETPGSLRLLKSPVMEHSIPSATIFTRVMTQEIQSIDTAIVKNGVFARRDLDISFRANKAAGRNYLLSFNVDQSGYGALAVYLNGNLLYERPVRERTPQPIPLPLDYIQDGDNKLTFRTTDVGIAFWQPNTYILHNILISGDLIDTSGSVSEQTFSIQEREIAGYEQARLEFVPDCDPRNSGRLTIHMNSRMVRDEYNMSRVIPNLLYTGFIDCGIRFTTDIPKDFLREGENRLLFASDGGQYVVDRIKVVVEMTENDYPVYYFNLPRDMFDIVDAGERFIRLTMRFADYRNVKSGEVIIDGFVQSFSTQDIYYQAIIDPAILNPGPNTIQVIPHIDRLDISELRIELV
ncbi:cellulose biosynthesis cyclic di-GMP-binding regulatory protein BcsB [Candidatus Woesearchaeota archaeon]|nr:cellulose biosynthesis cyclic di-GMP-binding regulatory protein BcsB [Candidatus Woesearchaeota archaeon]